MNRLNLLISLGIYLFIVPKVAAQIIPDNTLPDNSRIEVTDSKTLIDGGTLKGNNLFHSFQEFSVRQQTHFNNAPNVENILGRITGSNLSIIDAAIGANGSANLFLLNPNGVVFTENAALNIGGSFTATSGDAIVFEKGSFNAITPEDSILTIAAPLGVQLGQNPGNIEVTGSGNRLFFDDFSTPITENRTSGLENNARINLIGGNVNFFGGNITSNEEITIVGGDSGTVSLKEASLDELNPRDLVFSQASSVSSSTGIILSGKNIDIADGSAALAMNGAKNGIEINAAETFTIVGESSSNVFPSYVSTDVAKGDAVRAGDITIDAGNAIASGGGQINVATFTSATGGNLTVNASSITAESGGRYTGSGFLADSHGSGDGGSVNLNADMVTVALGGEIGSTSFGQGTAGNININANTIEVDGEEFNYPSKIFSDTDGLGSGGQINLEAKNLRVTNAGQIFTTAFSEGDAGTINIKAEDIYLGNTIADVNPDIDTGIFSTSGNRTVVPELLGTGGTINIEAGNLEINNEAIITVGSFSASNGGQIEIDTDSLTVGTDPQSPAPKSAGLISTIALGAGDAGNITVNSQNTAVTNGGQIQTLTTGSGNAGNISLKGKELNISGFSTEGSSAIVSSALADSGNGGNIITNVENIALLEGGTINASNFPTQNTKVPLGTGKAGTIEINAKNIKITGETFTSINTTANAAEGGKISVNSENVLLDGNGAAITGETLGTSNGGNTNIDTQNLNLQNGGSILVSATAEGNAGNINLEAKNINGDRGSILAESQISGGGNLNIQSEKIDLNSNSLVSTSVKDSNGGGGDITINNGNFILLRNDSDIRANAEFGPGGNINITSSLLFSDFNSDIDASSRFGLDGTIEVNSEFSEELNLEVLNETPIDPVGLITSACPISDENSFAYIGNGGIAKTPSSNASVTTTWLDERSNRSYSPAKEITYTQNPVEAKQLKVSDDGSVELLAAVAVDSLLESGCSHP